jgi:hypothetical protein
MDERDSNLVMNNTLFEAPRVTVLHSVARHSAGFGGASALQGRILGLLGEMVGDQLPTLIQFVENPAQDLLHGLLLENVTGDPSPNIANLERHARLYLLE